MPKSSEKPKAAVLERERRSTAGKRMSSLIGKAQEDDDAFWSHSIWSEVGGGYTDGKSSRKKRRRDVDDDTSSSPSDDDDDEEGTTEGGDGSADNDDEESVSSGEGSFRISDEGSGAVDEFDSDFDESESDDDDRGADGDEGEEEKELHAEERRNAVAAKRKKNQRLGVPLSRSAISSAGRELMKKKTGKVSKRGPLGEGWNEGLVLNWPPPLLSSLDGMVGVAVPRERGRPLKSTTVTMTQTTIIDPQQISSQPITQQNIDIAATAQLPQQQILTGVTSVPTFAPNIKPPTKKLKRQLEQEAISERKQSQRQQFTQEELIVEAIKYTETDNSKWINARKRSKEEAAQLEKSTNSKKSSSNQQPISRFHSRRGCNTTITFMNMDYLPEILTRRQTSSSVGYSTSKAGSSSPRQRRTASESIEYNQQKKKDEKCVITGKIAKYRDPKSMLGYHDLDAYKELRRRIDSGELKLSRPGVQKKNGKSNNGTKPKRKCASMTATFTLGQSTMIADMSYSGSTSKEAKVKVMQNGLPVSPPSELVMSVPAVESSQDNRKEPTPLLPSLNLDGHIHNDGEMDHSNGHNAKNGVQVAIAANDSQPRFPDSTKSAQLAPSDNVDNIPSANKDNGSADLKIDSTIILNRDNDGGNIGNATRQISSAPETTSTLPILNNQLNTANGVPSFKSKETIVPPSPPATKMITRQNGDPKSLVTTVNTPSNGKRTTIEAN
jgi:hypothetical protein